MPRVVVVTDSTADVPPDIAEELSITVIPCNVHVRQKTYLDGIDLSRAELAQLLASGPPFPTTSSPGAGVFAETYRRVARHGEQVISIHLASKLSAVYNVARVAAEMVPEINVALVDSCQVSMCTGLLAIAAARAAAAGQGAVEIVGMLQDMVPRLRLLAFIEDLAHLRRSGRVGWLSAMVGTVLRIKPIILVEDGEAKLVEKVRTQAKAVARLVELCRDYGPIDEIVVLHLDAPEAAASLAAHLGSLKPGYPVRICEAGVVVGAHAGPGCVGAAMLLAKTGPPNPR